MSKKILSTVALLLFFCLTVSAKLSIKINEGDRRDGSSLENAINNTVLSTIFKLEVILGDFTEKDWMFLIENSGLSSDTGGLRGLKTFIITEGVTTVADTPDSNDPCFYFSIEKVSVEKLLSIGNSAFFGCSELTDVSFPEVEDIRLNAFSGCSKLTEVSFPKAVYIDQNAFSDCSALQTLNFPEAINIENRAFSGCSKLTEVNFPKVETIRGEAFSNCSTLAAASFPKVKDIGVGVFENCIKLDILKLGATTVPSVGSSAFNGTSPIMRTLVLVDAMGDPLPAGQAYNDAKTAYDNQTGAAGLAGDGKWYGWNIGAAAVVLPVEILYFSAEKKGEDVRLDWATATEVNNARFFIERSGDGVDFTEIGFVDGGGTTSTEQVYRYMDRNPATGIDYYRLRQVDYDGHFEYSKVVSVPYISKEPTIYPNPAIDVLHLSASLPYRIYNTRGELMLQGSATQIDIADLPSGMYIIQLRGSVVKKFVKR